MLLQELYQPCSGAGNAVEPCRQGTQSANKQPGIEWLNATAYIKVFAVEDLFHHGMAAGKYAAQRITVPPDVFGGGLHGKVYAQRNRLLVQGAAIAIITYCNDV